MIKFNKQIKETYKGLNSIDVKNSLKRYGTNTFDYDINQSLIDKLIVCLSNPNVLMICLVFLINIIFIISTCYWFRSVGIMIVLLIIIIFTIMFRYAITLKFKRISNDTLNVVKNYVWRDGHLILIPETEIVVGDFVQVTKGDILPADGILIKGSLSVNQYILNNNNNISRKISMDKYNNYNLEDDDINNPNMLFKMSIVDNGLGTMLVTHIGKNTYCYKNKCYIEYNKQIGFKETANFNIDNFVKKANKVGYMLAFVSMFVYLYNCVFIKNSFCILNILSYVNSLNFACDVLNAVVLVLILILILVPEELRFITKIIFSLNYHKILKNNVMITNYKIIENINSVDYLIINDDELDYYESFYHYNISSKDIKILLNKKTHIVLITKRSKEELNKKIKKVGLIDNINKNSIVSRDEISRMSDVNIFQKLNNIKVITDVNYNIKKRILNIIKNRNCTVAIIASKYEDIEILRDNNVIISFRDSSNYIKKYSDIVIENKELTNLFNVYLYNKLVDNSVKKIILFKSIVCYCLVIFNIISIIINGFLAINIIQMIWIYLISYFIMYLAYTNNISCENIKHRRIDTDCFMSLKFYVIIFSACFIFFSLLYFNIPLEGSIFRVAKNSIYIRTGYFNVFIIWILLLSIMIKLHGRPTKLYTRCNYIFIFIICFNIITQLFMIYFKNSIFDIISLNILELKFTILYAVLIILLSVMITKYLKRLI